MIAMHYQRESHAQKVPVMNTGSWLPGPHLLYGLPSLGDIVQGPPGYVTLLNLDYSLDGSDLNVEWSLWSLRS